MKNIFFIAPVLSLIIISCGKETSDPVVKKIMGIPQNQELLEVNQELLEVYAKSNIGGYQQYYAFAKESGLSRFCMKSGALKWSYNCEIPDVNKRNIFCSRNYRPSVSLTIDEQAKVIHSEIHFNKPEAFDMSFTDNKLDILAAINDCQE